MTRTPRAPDVQALVARLLRIAARRTGLLPGAELRRDADRRGGEQPLTVAQAVDEYVWIESVALPGLAFRQQSARTPQRLDVLERQAAILEIRRRVLGATLGLLNPGPDWSPRPMTDRRPRRKEIDR